MAVQAFAIKHWEILFIGLLVTLFIVYATFLNKSKLSDNDGSEHGGNSKGVGRRVVMAANKYSNGLVLVGIRHWDKLMHTQAMFYDENNLLPRDGDPEQGFIDNKGNFLTREEAYVIAKKSKQIIRRVGGDDNRLYSENLY